MFLRLLEICFEEFYSYELLIGGTECFGWNKQAQLFWNLIVFACEVFPSSLVVIGVSDLVRRLNDLKF